MKILVISNLYPPNLRGGAEQIAYRITQELNKQGHKVTVFTTRPFEGIKSCKAEVGEKLVEPIYRMFPPNLYYLLNDNKIPVIARALWHLIDAYSPAPARELKYIIKREKPDVILTHNLKGLGLQVVKEIKRSGVFHIHTVHDVQLSIPSGLLMAGQEKSFLNRSWFRKIYEKQIQKIFGSPDVVISPSQFLADFYRERNFFPNSRIEVLPNPLPDFDLVKKDNNIPNSPLRILFTGQLEKHKGTLWLLRLLDQIDVPFKLHIVGDGTLADYVNDWTIRDTRVVYHGFVSLEYLMKLFSICHVTVVPSFCYENSPTIIYESFLAGVPVIASNLGGIGELVKEAQNGYLFEAGNQEQFLAAIKKIVNNTDHLLDHQDKIREIVKDYSLENYTKQLRSFFPPLS
ncbi:glycosyltransferase family 4 protein [Patescibacteria group bacterium]